MYFLFILANILAAVAVSIYMLNQTRGYYDDESSIYPEMVSDETLDAYIASYMQSMGEFTTDTYNNGDNPKMIWFFFCLATFLTTITILNMLIAVMGETFAQQNEIRALQELREKVLLSSDYSFLLDGKENFSHQDKYLFTFQPVALDDENSIEKMIESLSEHVTQA